MTDRTSKNLSKFPKYGWKVKLDHQFPEKRDQNLKPRLKQILPLLPLGLRYLKWFTGKVGEHYFQYFFLILVNFMRHLSPPFKFPRVFSMTSFDSPLSSHFYDSTLGIAPPASRLLPLLFKPVTHPISLYTFSCCSALNINLFKTL